MKKFLKDYWNLCKDSGTFYKKHWLGVIILNIVGSAAVLAWFFREQIIENFKEKFKMGKKETQ